MNICKYCYKQKTCDTLKKHGTMQGCTEFDGDETKLKIDFNKRFR